MNEKLTVYGENLCCEGGANRVLTLEPRPMTDHTDDTPVTGEGQQKIDCSPRTR
jgi:hypothetical protein